ncbi:hypothetical protein FZX09_03965 [Synechococcus sp. MU1643]|uniref:hypothetical protein n=1 Tax=Synechococcus sp. MU1643 TaxID=2508349 RepID=UPI001CF8F832|nr:hypothetical protein [Synechococcus sp. MU1643]MCB4427969.1 hypothetical protein [Synechococcus sp. MU1643]
MSKDIKIPRPGAPKVGRHPKASDKAPEGNWMDRGITVTEGTRKPSGVTDVSSTGLGRVLKTSEEPIKYDTEAYDFRRFSDHPDTDSSPTN